MGLGLGVGLGLGLGLKLGLWGSGAVRAVGLGLVVGFGFGFGWLGLWGKVQVWRKWFSWMSKTTGACSGSPHPPRPRSSSLLRISVVGGE